jgi:hypothetical protein
MVNYGQVELVRMARRPVLLTAHAAHRERFVAPAARATHSAARGLDQAAGAEPGSERPGGPGCHDLEGGR